MITIEQVDLWRDSDSEHQSLEFKEAKNQYDFTKACKYCVAIANEGGGHLLFGVADKKPRPIVGTKVAENPVGYTEALFAKLGFRVDVEEVQHPDGRIVVLSIPPRPHGTAYHFDGSYLMRSGERLLPMSEDQLRGIFAEGKPNWLSEASLRGQSSQEVIELLDTQSFFSLLHLPYPTTQAATLERLQAERLIEQTAEGYTIFRLGALLLAKDLRSFPDLSRKVPRVVAYDGTNKLSTRLDHSEVKGYAVGFQSLLSFVMSQLPQSEQIQEGGLRKQTSLLPELAIRELIANALIHQDFHISGASVMIELYTDRIEISNPGEPLVPVERFIDGYQSRNEELADLLRRMGICEEKSSGIDKVIYAAETGLLPPPKFHTTHQRTVAIMFGPKKFKDMDKEERSRACYQHCAWKWVSNERMTNQSLRGRFKLTSKQSAIASQIIAATIDAGLIKADDAVGSSRKFARYLPFWA